MDMREALEPVWRRAIEAGELGVWDLRPELETVHYSPQWKQRLGFSDPYGADSTHFWRCRVHPEDLAPMLAEMRDHVGGISPLYQASFRLRSNGSGYRTVRSRGRVIERNVEGRAMRLVGTMIDLTPRPCIPRGGLPEGPRGAMAGLPLEQPFHMLLASQQPSEERDRVLRLTQDLLRDAVAQLDGLRRG